MKLKARMWVNSDEIENEIVLRNEIQNKFGIAVNDKTGDKNKNDNDNDNENKNDSENGNKNENENENENEDVCYMESIYRKSNQEEVTMTISPLYEVTKAIDMKCNNNDNNNNNDDYYNDINNYNNDHNNNNNNNNNNDYYNDHNNNNNDSDNDNNDDHNNENNFSSFYKENQNSNVRSKNIRKIQVGTITPYSKRGFGRLEEGARDEVRRFSNEDGETMKLSSGTLLLF